MKIFILSNTGKMYVVSTVDALKSVSIAPAATDLAFAADGSFAYVAGAAGNNVAAFSTCSTPSAASANIGNVATSGPPLRIFPLPRVQELTMAPDHSLVTQNVLASGAAQHSTSDRPLYAGSIGRQPVDLQASCAHEF